ncbi:DHA2 family efflux MFS transporter permease subunit [Actinokineospora globicatena]|uniref:MFS transporter n=1 Tax=Actinokineospora globicatena TaxID=103729 RepID=A0A9W6V619_9PSEU|nr:DHA2 family efflux MFS transporter permease subunit [Actinokineospora globicatena]GLW89957.1 MFS transporter [Actinokineospora globicatena]
MVTSVLPGSRWLALGVLCAGALMVVLDASVVAVALPTIQDDLGFTAAGLAWVVNSYLIAFGGLLLLSGRLGDLLGRKRVFLAGLVVFTVASLACGLATSPGLLVAARFVQGVGGAAASAVVLGMVVTMFPEPAERTKAIGVYSFVQAAGASIGVIAGGALTQGVGWPWIFLVNVPIGVVTVVLAIRWVADDPGHGQGLDVLGAALVTAGLSLLVFTISHSGGWLLGTASVALLGLFVLRQAKAAHPLLRLEIFRSRWLTGANVVMLLLVAGLFGFQFLGALYLRRVLDYSAVETSLAFLPGPVLIGVVSLILAPRVNTRAALTVGLLLVTAALLLLARAPVDGRYLVDVLPVMVLMGVGAGLTMPAVMGIAMADIPPQDAGLASGLLNTTQQVGGAIGLAVLSTLAASHSGEAQALLSGYHLAFLVAAAFVAAATVIALVIPRRPSKRDGGAHGR